MTLWSYDPVDWTSWSYDPMVLRPNGLDQLIIWSYDPMTSGLDQLILGSCGPTTPTGSVDSWSYDPMAKWIESVDVVSYDPVDRISWSYYPMILRPSGLDQLSLWSFFSISQWAGSVEHMILRSYDQGTGSVNLVTLWIYDTDEQDLLILWSYDPLAQWTASVDLWFYGPKTQ
jgi:hypothetical protein